MYKIDIEFTDYMKRKRHQEVSFNLDGREVFKMLPELKSVFDWMESNRDEEPRELSAEEVSSFYNDFEAILLAAWGEMSEDGLHFRKGGKYEFEESAVFNACMIKFVLEPEKIGTVLQGMMPIELFEMVQKANPEQVAEVTDSRLAEQQAEIVRLKAQLESNDVPGKNINTN